LGILNYPEPADDLIYPKGIWHYARGLAYTARNNFEAAEQELKALEQIAANDTLQEITIWEINTTQELMQIATHVLEGELAARKNDFPKAIAHLEEAINIEDQLSYNEPPDWFFPVRQSLGAVLLSAGKPKEAEGVYREDLKKFPENGWSLYGLYESLLAQGRQDEAKEVYQRFEQAWIHADVELAASRII